MSKRKVVVFDNGGQTWDRYTIILPDGDMFGASTMPFNPQGFGQYVGNVCEMRGVNNKHHFDHKKGVWNRHVLEHEMRMYLKECKDNPSMGKRTRVLSLPLDVQKYVAQLMEEVTN